MLRLATRGGKPARIQRVRLDRLPPRAPPDSGVEPPATQEASAT
jgi:hypothetical protein